MQGHDFPPALLFIGVFILILAVIWFQARLAAERRKRLAAWAQSKGWRFEADRERGLDSAFPDFGCLRTGDGRYAYNRILGEWKGSSVLGFDYHYQTHSSGSKGQRRTHHHCFSALILESPIPLKSLLIRPEGLWDKLTEFFGMDDIDFESTEFSRKFFVKAADRRWAFDMLHARTMQRLLDSPVFSMQMSLRHLILWRATTYEPLDFEDALTLATALLEGMPEYLVKQQLGQPNSIAGR